MILIEAGAWTDAAFAAKALLARRLARRGHRVMIDDASFPAGFPARQKYELSDLLADPATTTPDRLILIGADTLGGEVLGRLRALRLRPDVPAFALGRFADHQAQVDATAKLSYALGHEVKVLDLGVMLPPPLPGAGILPLVSSLDASGTATKDRPTLTVVVPPEMLDQPLTLQVLAIMNLTPDWHLRVVSTQAGKAAMQKSRYAAEIAVFDEADVLPETLARGTDLAAVFGDALTPRMAAFAADVICQGNPLVDCTEGRVLAETGAPALRGLPEIGTLPVYLDQTVLTNSAHISRTMLADPWVAASSPAPFEAALGLTAVADTVPADRPARVLFVPTNGIGLGHAQRCLTIAGAMAARDRSIFAAFPSCLPLARARGFDGVPLVPKSPQHREQNANDIVNALRLGRLVRAGDVLVFDGGYVFGSVCRTIMDKDLRAVWIRRGLWQAGQIGQTPLERERLFRKVIVPGEAFAELNDAISHGPHVHRVGPVLQRLDQTAEARAEVRGRIAQATGRDFDRLVVTMLGAGAAADRTAQTAMLCGLFERRPDVLHLIVVWPGAQVAPALSGWTASRVVQTLDAVRLLAAADFAVSAAGYNSFHEMLYGRVPAVFVPQVAPMMDDQDRRARAASDRGLAETVEATDLLRLQREIAAFLDGGKAEDIRARLADAVLPALGTATAAALIDEELGA